MFRKPCCSFASCRKSSLTKKHQKCPFPETISILEICFAGKSNMSFNLDVPAIDNLLKYERIFTKILSFQNLFLEKCLLLLCISESLVSSINPILDPREKSSLLIPSFDPGKNIQQKPDFSQIILVFQLHL